MIGSLVVLVSLSQIGSRAVTYSGPPQIADLALAKLSKAAGQKLVAGPRVGSDILLISVKGAKLNELADKLAIVTKGKWTRVGDAWVLDRSPEDEARQKEAETTQTLQLLTEQSKAYTRALSMPWTAEGIKAVSDAKKKTEARPGAHWPNGFETYGPVPRAVARCLKDVSLADVAKLRRGDRLVYSTEPNAMQHPLGENARDAMGLLQAEQVLWGDVLRTIPIPPTESRREDHNLLIAKMDEIQASNFHDPWGRSVPFAHQPTRLTLAFDRDWSGVIQLIFRAYLPDGRVYLGWSPDHMDKVGIGLPELQGPQVKSRTALSALRGEVKASPDAKAYSLLEDSEAAANQVAAARKHLQPYLNDVVTHDPLNLSVGPALTAAAKKLGKQLVANLSDSTYFVGTVEEGTVNLEIMQNELTDSARVDLTGSWMLIQPQVLHEEKAQTTDRRRLIPLLQSLRSNGPTISWAADMAAANALGFDSLYASIWGTELYGTTESGFLEFLGSLPATQRSAALSGKGLTVKELTPDQRTLLYKWLVTGYTPILQGWSPESKFSAYDEPTNLLPNGLPPEAKISTTKTESELLEFIDPLDGSVAFSALMEEDPSDIMIPGKTFKKPKSPTKKLLVQLRKRARYTSTISLAQGIEPKVEYLAGLSKPYGKTTLNKLPAEKAKRIREWFSYFSSRAVDP